MLTFIDLVLEVEDELRDKKIRGRVERWVNRAARDICRTYPWSFLGKETTTRSTADAPAYYQVPDDFAAPLSVRWEDTSGVIHGPIQVIHKEKMDKLYPDQRKTGTLPEAVAFFGRLIQFYPCLASVAALEADRERIILSYRRSHPEMSLDSHVSLIPDSGRDVIVDWASYRGAKFLWNDSKDLAIRKTDVKEGLQAMILNEKGDDALQDRVALDDGLVDLLMDAG